MTEQQIVNGFYLDQRDITAVLYKEHTTLPRAVCQGENQRYLAIIQVMPGVGLRMSKAAALKVSDLEMNDRATCYWTIVREDT